VVIARGRACYPRHGREIIIDAGEEEVKSGDHRSRGSSSMTAIA